MSLTRRGGKEGERMVVGVVVSFTLSRCRVGRSRRDVESCGGSVRRRRGGKGWRWWKRMVVVGKDGGGGCCFTWGSCLDVS